LISVQNNRSTIAYRIGAFNDKNLLAWPGFAMPLICPDVASATASNIASFVGWLGKGNGFRR
jgi:hypothetical protein